MKKAEFETVLLINHAFRRVLVKGYSTFIDGQPVNVYKDQRGIWYVINPECGASIGYSYDTRAAAIRYAAVNMSLVTPEKIAAAREIYKKAASND